MRSRRAAGTVRSRTRLLAGPALIACLALLTAGCSGGSSSPGHDHSSGAQITKGHGDHDGDTDGDDDDDDEAGDPDADLPGADRGPEMPDDAFLMQRITSTGVPGIGAFDDARAQAARITDQTRSADPELLARTWTFRGPKSVGGRVVDASADPQHKGGLYVASATAGVWYSSDSGATFTSVWPTGVTHSMGAIAVAPDGTVYAGTGETNPGGGSITYGGDGIYKSTDGGATWTHLGLAKSGTIGRIVIDPANPRHIWVAVSGNLFNPGGQRGVYVTSNGGTTWKRSFAPPNNTTGAADIAVDPDNPKHVLAALWDHQRKPDDRRYTGIGSGIWQTWNAGKTWKRLGTKQGLLAPSDETGRIGVAFAPSSPSRVYAIYANNDEGEFQDFFTSTDNGKTWSEPAGNGQLGGSQSSYGWWFGRVFVDPTDADHVYLTGLDMYVSTNAAASWSEVGGLHADQHAVAWDTHAGGDVYIGNDGGLYASTTGTSWTKSDDEPWSQYVSLDVSAQKPSHFIGGLQDNGTIASWTDPKFQDIFGGDGQRALINPTDADNYYACYQYGNCGGWLDGTRFSLPIRSDRFPFFMPMEFAPSDPTVIYAGGNELNRSTDSGHTFTVLTGDLGHGGGHSTDYPYGTISAIGLSASDPNLIWIGTDNGYLYRSTDGGSHMVQQKRPITPRRWITRLTVDPTDSDSVYLTLSGYRSGDNAPYVLHTTDGGQTWTDITGNLPHAPVSDITIVGAKLYVATDVGVFTAREGSTTWRSLGSGLPQAIVTDLHYVAKNGSLYVSTFGMGVWSIKI